MIIYAGMYTSFESFGNYRQKCYTSIVGNNVLVIRLGVRVRSNCSLFTGTEIILHSMIY